MVGDPAGNDSFEDSLNKIIAKNVLVLERTQAEADRLNALGYTHSKWSWADGSALDPKQRTAESMAESGADDTAEPGGPAADAGPSDGAGAKAARPPPPLHTGWEDPPGSVTLYKVDELKDIWAGGPQKPWRNFTADGSVGSIFQPVFQQLKAELGVPEPAEPNDDDDEDESSSAWQAASSSVLQTLTRTSAEGYRHLFLLPAFFETLHQLQVVQGRDIRLVIRTFGHDLPDVVAALNCFCNGLHPDFPLASPYARTELAKLSIDGQAQPGTNRDSQIWCGRYHPAHLPPLPGPASTGGRGGPTASFRLQPFPVHTAGAGGAAGVAAGGAGEEGPEPEPEVGPRESDYKGESKAVLMLQRGLDPSGMVSAQGIQDDYHYWKRNRYNPAAGKPMWVTRADREFHHIFFDDNIHNQADDSVGPAPIPQRPHRNAG